MLLLLIFESLAVAAQVDKYINSLERSLDCNLNHHTWDILFSKNNNLGWGVLYNSKGAFIVNNTDSCEGWDQVWLDNL